jgi:hypothetical protein
MMKTDFRKFNRSISSTGSKPNTEDRSNSENDVAYTESPSDVITVCDRSHMTHQERQEFWENMKYPDLHMLAESII